MATESLAQTERKARGKKSLFSLIKMSIAEWSDDDAATWSAALACYAILALAPLAVLALKVFTLVAATHLTSGASARDQLQSVASQWMGSASGDAIREILDRASQPGQGKWAAAISLVIAIVSAGGVLAELQQAMNRIWKVKAKPGNAVMTFARARLLSLLVIVIAATVLLASVVITSWIEKLTGSFGLSWKYLTWGIDVVASAVAATLIFALIYRTIPDVTIEWKTTWVGAAIGAALFLVGKYGLALYFKFGSPTSAFGAVGSLAAVLIWVYYSCLIIFFGAELTQVFVKTYGYRVEPSEHARWLSECDETETATPSSYGPGQKPMRPYEGTQTRPNPAGQSRFGPSMPPARALRKPYAIQPRRDIRPAVIVAGAAAATAAVAGYFALLRRQSRAPVDARSVDRVSREIDRLTQRVALLTAR